MVLNGTELFIGRTYVQLKTCHRIGNVDLYPGTLRLYLDTSALENIAVSEYNSGSPGYKHILVL
jgi:hypothetical protein